MSSVLSTGYLKADVSPRYPLIPPGSESALVANDGTVRTSQCEPLVQGHKYNIPNSSLRVYLCLFPAAVYVLLSRGSKSLSRTMLFVMMVVMFVLSTVYWVISVVITFLLMRAWFSELDPATHSPPDWLPMFNAVLLVNFIITDGVVVWRAWVICPDQNRAILMTPVVLLAIDSLAYLTAVVARAGLFMTQEGTHIHILLARVIDIAQVSNLGLSLLTNVVATSIIAAKSWKYRKSMRSYGVDNRKTMASKVLGFLVESGMLYIFIGTILLASLFIHMSFATLGDILLPVAVQLAGIYPIIVLVFVDLSNSFKSTTHFSSGSIVIRNNEDRATHLTTLSFAPVSGPGTDSHLSHPDPDRPYASKKTHRIPADEDMNAENDTDRSGDSLA
ncbi:hypothetical protein BGY98DRAFT_693311 [Russula aff. rugulosa BPL654]|nr:hypothetical protein BGY98DRAFT_693311 [Russula aff. rugulosa BPL654]